MAIGFNFPFAKATGSLGLFQMTESEDDAAKNNLRVLLTTNRGERLMYYDFGCSLRDFLFEQQKDSILKAKISDRIIYQINKWMPFVLIDVLEIYFSSDKPDIPDNSIGIYINFRLTKRPDNLNSLFVIV